MLPHECSAALKFIKRRHLDSSCHAAHAYPSRPNSEIDQDPPPLMNEAARLILVSFPSSHRLEAKRNPVTRCSVTHGQLHATISCTCSYKFIGYKRQDFLNSDMYQYLQGSLCPCMVEEITINKFASSFF
jgi:hypothetical protein